jgi:predicted RNase H-like HicB family nuclease
MNLPNPTAPKQEITVTLMLEPQASGGFVASAVEFPAVRVEAATEAAAIAELQQALGAHVAHAKIMPWVMPVSPIEGVMIKPAWTKFVGIFQDDADFAAIMDELRAERESDDESEIDPAYYLEN